jgi:hypothetical protein
MKARSFDELVIPIAHECPHAVVLDWFRRLEAALTEYAATRARALGRGRVIDRLLASDELLPANIVWEIASLRALRNEVQHASATVTAGAAIHFARKALWLSGELALVIDARAAA